MSSSRPLPGFNKVLSEVPLQLELTLKEFSEDPVHDLRVALRRSRSVAFALKTLDLDPSWRALDRLARRPFKALGNLRDLQVKEGWLLQICPPELAPPPQLLALYQEQQKKEKGKAKRVLSKFPIQEWKQLSKNVLGRVKRLHPDSPALLFLGYCRFEEVKTLHQTATKSGIKEDWHQLRIGVKRLRYFVENFLPLHREEFLDDLKKVQELLGDVHDLDVLRQDLEEKADLSPEELSVWIKSMDRERNSRLKTYRTLSSGKVPLWTRFEKALPSGKQLQESKSAYLFELGRSFGDEPGLKERLHWAEKVCGVLSGMTPDKPITQHPLFVVALFLPQFSKRKSRERILGALRKTRFFQNPNTISLIQTTFENDLMKDWQHPDQSGVALLRRQTRTLAFLYTTEGFLPGDLSVDSRDKGIFVKLRNLL